MRTPFLLFATLITAAVATLVACTGGSAKSNAMVEVTRYNDLRSIFAFLKSTKPVKNVVPAWKPLKS